MEKPQNFFSSTETKQDLPEMLVSGIDPYTKAYTPKIDLELYQQHYFS